ncbi:OmpA family protein [Halomonas sp. 18H]|nr:OmpA family protein [Halomonas sp. 18H]MCW4153703.1 OmpA family protein [Halomonas sp. 18H]
MHSGIHRNVARVLGIAGMAVLGLHGCASSSQQPTGEPSQSASTSKATSPAQQEVTFPDLDSAWIEDGTYVNIHNLRKMQERLSKDQVVDLLGTPHFDEGLFGVHEWNYIFNLPDGNGGYRVCQYQIQYDEEMQSESMHWKSSACAALVEPEGAPERITLAADALFAFDSHELSSQGHQEIAELARTLQEEYKSPEIFVMGHTDRFGSDAYNMTLSERRAAEVRSVLIDQGIAPSSVRSQGYGESRPVVNCPGAISAAVKECLKPNRRVELEVMALPAQ